jgi:ferric-dicitrate binding protein FerR (iron transport regulator)
MNSEILKKFFSGKANPDEVHKILIWINSPEGQKEMEQLMEDFQDEIDLDEHTSERIKESVFEKINLPNLAEENDSRKVDNIAKISKRGRNSGLKIAIAACFTFCALWFFSSRMNVFENKVEDKQVSQAVNFIERSVSKGQKLKIKLGDGSEVQLNTESSIRFPEKFSSDQREVFLEGEAFFDVKPDPNRPFIVHTKSLQTRVLGTSFTVKEIEGNPAGMVAVLTGKVQVSIQDAATGFDVRKVDLKPMDAASFDFKNKSMLKKRVDYDDVFAWKDNVISFKNATFQEIISRLETWYGVEFSIPKNFNAEKDYSGKFENQTLEEVLIGLSFIYDFNYKIEKNRIAILKN